MIIVSRANAMRAASYFWEHHRDRGADGMRETYELAVSRLTGLSTKPPPPSSETIVTPGRTLPGVGL